MIRILTPAYPTLRPFDLRELTVITFTAKDVKMSGHFNSLTDKMM